MVQKLYNKHHIEKPMIWIKKQLYKYICFVIKLYVLFNCAFYLSHSVFYLIHIVFFIYFTMAILYHSGFYLIQSVFFNVIVSFYLFHGCFYLIHSSYFKFHSVWLFYFIMAFLFHGLFYLFHGVFSCLSINKNRAGLRVESAIHSFRPEQQIHLGDTAPPFLNPTECH